MPLSLSSRPLSLQSEIRSMSLACNKVKGINMAQGVCDCALPLPVGIGAKEAIDKGINTYTRYDGRFELRSAIAEKYKRFYGMSLDAEKEIVVSAGSTGAFYSACMALLNPGDEIIIFEPFYGYHINILTSLGIVPHFVQLKPPTWDFSLDELSKAITLKTRAILINTPVNPCGKVFSLAELTQIADLAQKHDLFVFTDEIYEHFVYDNKKHIPISTIANMHERTILISGLSKTFSITGWRIGYAICSDRFSQTIGHCSDLVYVCAPAPLQIGAAMGIKQLADSYYTSLKTDFLKKRTMICDALLKAGLTPHVPSGAYYVLVDISRIPGNSSKEKALYFLDKTGIAFVPGCAFYHDNSGENIGRFCFAKEDEVLEEVCGRLEKYRT
jgi:aminotransferase